MTNYDGGGRLTADEIAGTWGERILAGASQLADKPGGGYREVWPSFLTRHYYGLYNWQTAAYEVVTRAGRRPVRPRATAGRAAR